MSGEVVRVEPPPMALERVEIASPAPGVLEVVEIWLSSDGGESEPNDDLYAPPPWSAAGVRFS